ncbi:MAG TPA: 3-deoxy-D-manno-octulosonic acid transferase [Blastocatellia bacterium]|nr:3-deoxy-D-manno-octulosonic acid transferase [Blastocatellia bacterium]
MSASKPQAMYFLYSLGLSLLFVALLPWFIIQALRHGKYAGSFKQRLGRLSDSIRGDGGRTIWLHAVSVGEFLASKPLIDQLKRELPHYRVVVSTTTLTGQQLAQSESNTIEGAFYFPFDWRFSVSRSLDWVKPSIVIILETELWPNFLRECRRRGVITILANGRISSRSFRRYRFVGSFISRVIGDLSLMIMQSDADAERARELGAPADRVRVCGNLKYDQPEDGGRGLRVGKEIDRQFALSSSSHLIVAGSTAPGEEEMLLAALRKIRTHTVLEDTRLLIAPRHPERFDEVARLIAKSGFKFARRSETASSLQTDVILLDTIGELASVYRFAAVVFVGGSLVPRGGHNIIEPAAFAKPIIVGKHTGNFRQIVADFAAAGALVQIDSNHLAEALVQLLSDRALAREMGDQAQGILHANRGACERTIAAIKEVRAI